MFPACGKTPGGCCCSPQHPLGGTLTIHAPKGGLFLAPNGLPNYHALGPAQEEELKLEASSRRGSKRKNSKDSDQGGADLGAGAVTSPCGGAAAAVAGASCKKSGADKPLNRTTSRVSKKSEEARETGRRVTVDGLSEGGRHSRQYHFRKKLPASLFARQDSGASADAAAADRGAAQGGEGPKTRGGAAQGGIGSAASPTRGTRGEQQQQQNAGSGNDGSISEGRPKDPKLGGKWVPNGSVLWPNRSSKILPRCRI